MTNLKKSIDSDANSWLEFKKKNKTKGFCSVTFQDGYLIEVDTKIQKVLDWAKTRGLK